MHPILDSAVKAGMGGLSSLSASPKFGKFKIWAAAPPPFGFGEIDFFRFSHLEISLFSGLGRGMAGRSGWVGGRRQASRLGVQLAGAWQPAVRPAGGVLSGIFLTVREHLYEFHQLEQPWRTQVDSTLNTYLTNFEQLVQQFNKSSDYSFIPLQQVAALAAKGLLKLGKKFDQERASTTATIAKLQTQVNELSTSKPDAPPSPPADYLADREQRLWDAI
ncbi:hypothetical protein DSO57_1006537 [Entomophthora muscae]|uniref:Uncharacterized protein n=1 Tax=Entomophthora muscae TaxID=34485 RepID=A0ACC2S9P6_9FUNG|nr:hypothetical protein DSO57_1006537 [Entomophthora muscae]